MSFVINAVGFYSLCL